MGIIRKNQKSEFDLDNDYFINFVSLKAPEEEHTHNFIELVYTLSGSGVHKINDKEYRVGSGDLLLVNYHSKHTVTPIEHLSYVDIMLKPEYISDTLEGTEDLFLLLQLSDFSDLSNQVIRNNLLLHFDSEEQKKIVFLLNWTKEEQSEGAPASNLILHSGISMLLSLVFRKMTEHQGIRLSLNNHLLSYIERNCDGKLLINEIAAKCGYSEEHFSRIFKANFGKSPVKYLSECRINKAKSLLLNTDKSIDTIITDCGFSNRTAFFKKFLSSTGQTPLQFRKNQK